MSFMPIRGGTRGGKDQFEWDDVKADKHRENYLGHSLMAPVGRWQKGKDLTWYSKKSKVLGQKETLKTEIDAVKRAEEEAMAAALGLKPKTLVTGNISKQELVEACRRQSVEDKEEQGQEERMTGLGFMKWSHRHSNQATATGAAMFESRPVHEVESGPPRRQAPPSLPPSAPPTAHRPRQEERKRVERLAKDASTSRHSRGKDKKKKRKKEKSRKKHRKDRSRKPHSSSGDSEEENSRRRRKRADSSSGDYEEGKAQRRHRKRRAPSSDPDDGRKRRKRGRERRSESKSESEESHRGKRHRERQEKTRASRGRHDSSSD